MKRKDAGLKLTKLEIAAAFGDSNWAAAYPPVLSALQLSAMLQIPLSTIYAWSSRGLLRGCGRRIGKHLRFFRDRVLLRIFNEGLDDRDSA
ncbi:MAG: DNA-binding protein [Planctomycetota bacterium]|nr:DNA-binding protein [Planctomycetota bacterium]